MTRLEQAHEYYLDDEVDKAISLYKEIIENGSSKETSIANRELGLIYLDEFDNKEQALKCFEKASYKGDRCGSYYYAITLLEEFDDGQTDLLKTIITHLFKSNYCLLSDLSDAEKSSGSKTLLRLLEQYFKNININNINEVMDCLKETGEWTKTTHDTKVQRALYLYGDNIISALCRLSKENINSIEICDNRINYLAKHFPKDQRAINTIASLGRIKVGLTIDNLKSVKEAQNLYQEISKLKDNTSWKAKINLFIARSYRDGTHGVEQSFDTAKNFYLSINNDESRYELNEMLYQKCLEKLENGDTSFIDDNLNLFSNTTYRNKAYNLAKKHKEKIYFNSLWKNKDSGDVETLSNIAHCFAEGIGTKQSREEALNIYLDLYKKYKTTSKYRDIVINCFDYLVNYYYITDDLDRLKKILVEGADNNFIINYNTLCISNKVRSYATSYYDFKQSKDISCVRSESNTIYYLYDYYKKSYVDDYPNDKHIFCMYKLFVGDVKKCYYNPKNSYKDFSPDIINFLNKLDGEWIICTVPGHRETNNNFNGVVNVLDYVKIDTTRFTRINSLIQRVFDIPEKARAASGERNLNYRIDLPSLGINSSYNIKGKKILVIDDITTSGCTLISCRCKLLDEGASEVVCLALGKTKDAWSEYYDF